MGALRRCPIPHRALTRAAKNSDLHAAHQLRTISVSSLPSIRPFHDPRNTLAILIASLEKAPGSSCLTRPLSRASLASPHHHNPRTFGLTAPRSIYRRALKLSLDWSVHRYIWRGQALYIRSLFEAKRDVRDPRLQKVRGINLTNDYVLMEWHTGYH